MSVIVDKGVQLGRSASQAVELTTASAAKHGLRAVRSFELRDALRADASAVPCRCPHHGTKHCTCDYIVLLVYGARPDDDGRLVGEVVIHSFEDQTAISIPVAPATKGEPEPMADPRLLRVLAEVVVRSSALLKTETT